MGARFDVHDATRTGSGEFVSENAVPQYWMAGDSEKSVARTQAGTESIWLHATDFRGGLIGRHKERPLRSSAPAKPLRKALNHCAALISSRGQEHDDQGNVLPDRSVPRGSLHL